MAIGVSLLSAMSETATLITAAIAALWRLISSTPRSSNPRLTVHDLPIEVWSCIVPLAMDKLGCRVLQSALDDADNRCRVAIAEAFRGNVCSTIDSENGNHVLQRVVELVAPQSIRFIVSEICEHSSPAFISRHRYGCRVFERLLEHFPALFLFDLVEGVLQDIVGLCGNQYGTYVAQHILEHGLPMHKLRLADALLAHVKWAALNQYAVCVLDSAMCYATVEYQRRIANAVLEYEGLLNQMAVSRRGSPAAARVIRSLDVDSAVKIKLAESHKQLRSQARGAGELGGERLRLHARLGAR